MSNSRPLLSLSVDSWKLRTGDLRLSPESEDDVEASPQSGDASEADIPSLPEDQDQGDQPSRQANRLHSCKQAWLVQS